MCWSIAPLMLLVFVVVMQDVWVPFNIFPFTGADCKQRTARTIRHGQIDSGRQRKTPALLHVLCLHNSAHSLAHLSDPFVIRFDPPTSFGDFGDRRTSIDIVKAEMAVTLVSHGAAPIQMYRLRRVCVWC